MSPARYLTTPTRVLAGALALLFVWSQGSRLAATEPDLTTMDMFQLLPVLLVVVILILSALSGRDVFTDTRWLNLFGIFPGDQPASPEQLERLRQLGGEAGGDRGAASVARRIAALESVLPATPAQQLELLRRGAPRGIFTRGSADRWLRRVAEEEALRARNEYLVEWLEYWREAGLEIEEPDLLDADACWNFAEAWSLLEEHGLPYEVPDRLHAFDVDDEAFRMRAALEAVPALRQNERLMLRRGIFRRSLHAAELDALLPEFLRLWRRDNGVDERDLLLYVVARHQPAVLTEPWAHREFVRGVEGRLEEPEYLRHLSPR